MLFYKNLKYHWQFCIELKKHICMDTIFDKTPETSFFWFLECSTHMNLTFFPKTRIGYFSYFMMSNIMEKNQIKLMIQRSYIAYG